MDFELLIIGIFVLTIIYFVLQQAIIPSLRVAMQYKLCALRDEVALKIATSSGKKRKNLISLQHSISISISEIEQLPPWRFIEFKRTIIKVHNIE